MNSGVQALRDYERFAKEQLIALFERTWQSLASDLPGGISVVYYFVHNRFLRRAHELLLKFGDGCFHKFGLADSVSYLLFIMFWEYQAALDSDQPQCLKLVGLCRTSSIIT